MTKKKKTIDSVDPNEEFQFIPDEPIYLKEFSQKAERIGYQIEMFSLQDVWKLGIDGSNVKVGVCDTGCSKSHHKPDGDLRNVVKVGSSVPSERSGYARNSHGSHCLGIIGMADDDKGAVGVAPKCKMVSWQVLSSRGSGQSNWIADGIRKAVDEGCHVINLSIGSTGYSREIYDSCEYAYKKNVIIVAANGNDGRRNSVDYPAANHNTVAVAACNNELERASFSDMGKETDTIAPGVRVFSCMVNGWGEMSGTSMATPFVAGLCALMVDAEIKIAGERLTMNVDDFRKVLAEFSLDLGQPGKDTVNGYGAMDVAKYVQYLHDTYKDEPIKPDPGDPSEPEPDNPLFDYPAESEFGSLKTVDIDGNDHLITYRKRGAAMKAILFALILFALTGSTAAQIKPVDEPGQYQDDDPARAIIQLLQRIEMKIDRVEETTGQTLKVTGSIKMDTTAIQAKQQAFLDSLKSLTESNKANSQSIVDAIRENKPSGPNSKPVEVVKTNQKTIITSVDFPSKSSPSYNLNGSWTAVRDRGKLINHLAGYNSEHNYARQWLNLMTTGQLWYLHDSSHGNGSVRDVRPVPVQPVSPTPRQPVNDCPGGVCPTASRNYLFPRLRWAR